MKKIEDNLANQETELEGLDLVDLGDVSEETRGTPAGFRWDGGFGNKI